MRTLVIDTATHVLSVALFDDLRRIAYHHESVGRGHAERLMPIVADLPYGGRADCIAVDVGPGSFTGVRIGVAAARALAFGWNIPVTGYSALSIIAATAIAEHRPEPQFPVVNTGGHGELFWQMFSASTQSATTRLASTPVSVLAAMLEDEFIYGSGAETLVSARGRGIAVDIEPDARNFFDLRPDEYSLAAKPLYGRAADAEPMAVRSAL